MTDLATLVRGVALAANAYGNKRQGDFNQRVQSQDMQQQVDRAWAERNAWEAQQAAMIDGMNQSNQVWDNYYTGYQEALPQFGPEAKADGLESSIADAVGRQVGSVQEGHSSDMGSSVQGRVSADYSGGIEGAADGSLARALNRAKLRGATTGYDNDRIREAGALGDMSSASSAASREANKIMDLAQIDANVAGYIPPEINTIVPGYENVAGSLGALLSTGANVYEGYKSDPNALGDPKGTMYPSYEPAGARAKHGGNWYSPSSWASLT